MAGICPAHGIFYILFHADPYHTGRIVRGVYRMSFDKFRIEVENQIIKLIEKVDYLEQELKKKVNLEFFNLINEKRRKEIKGLEK